MTTETNTVGTYQWTDSLGNPRPMAGSIEAERRHQLWLADRERNLASPEGLAWQKLQAEKQAEFNRTQAEYNAARSEQLHAKKQQDYRDKMSRLKATYPNGVGPKDIGTGKPVIV